MRSKDVLKEALRSFDGTLIVVSHDRDFLDGLVDKVYEFGGGRVREHLGGIYAFLEHKQMDNLRELERSNAYASEETPAESSSAKQDYADRKAAARILRRMEKEVAEAEKEIADMEAELKKTEERLATPEGAADAGLYSAYSFQKNRLEEAMTRWESLSEQLESIN
jgi:ATP-binding cassette subfamily F protein 3